MRMFYNLLIFTICLNLSAYMLPLFIELPATSPLTTDPLGLTNTFTIETFSFLAVGGAAIGLGALLLRQGTYALYALLLWVVGVFLPIVRNFLLALPILLNSVMPIEMNPLYPAANPLSLVLTAIVTFAGFMFFMELVTQRTLT